MPPGDGHVKINSKVSFYVNINIIFLFNLYIIIF
jgi:hypothetical protein